MLARRPRIALGAALLLIVTFPSGCALRYFGIRAEPADLSSGPPSLAEDEGLVVFQVDTDVRLSKLLVSSVVEVAEDLPAGRYTLARVLPTGRYEWSAFERKIRGRDVKWLVAQEDRRFDVRSGVINYAGSIIIRTDAPVYSSGYAFLRESWMWYAILNRSAWVMAELEATSPGIWKDHRLRWAGEARDDFLDRYYAAREGQEASAGGAAP